MIPMSDMREAIMDAAERRMRQGGYGAFSFRDIAAEVGVKSSTVHYYYPAKEDLAAAVVHRYTDLVVARFDEALKTNPDPTQVWVKGVGGTACENGMCPGTLMGAMSQDLPPKVALEVKRFFQMHLDKAIAAGLTPAAAAQLVALTMGAMVVANAMGDPSYYDRATADFPRHAA